MTTTNMNDLARKLIKGSKDSINSFISSILLDCNTDVLKQLIYLGITPYRITQQFIKNTFGFSKTTHKKNRRTIRYYRLEVFLLLLLPPLFFLPLTSVVFLLLAYTFITEICLTFLTKNHLSFLRTLMIVFHTYIYSSPSQYARIIPTHKYTENMKHTGIKFQNTLASINRIKEVPLHTLYLSDLRALDDNHFFMALVLLGHRNIDIDKIPLSPSSSQLLTRLVTEVLPEETQGKKLTTTEQCNLLRDNMYDILPLLLSYTALGLTTPDVLYIFSDNTTRYNQVKEFHRTYLVAAGNTPNYPVKPRKESIFSLVEEISILQQEGGHGAVLWKLMAAESQEFTAAIFYLLSQQQQHSFKRFIETLTTFITSHTNAIGLDKVANSYYLDLTPYLREVKDNQNSELSYHILREITLYSHALISHIKMLEDNEPPQNLALRSVH